MIFKRLKLKRLWEKIPYLLEDNGCSVRGISKSLSSCKLKNGPRIRICTSWKGKSKWQHEKLLPHQRLEIAIKETISDCTSWLARCERGHSTNGKTREAGPWAAGGGVRIAACSGICGAVRRETTRASPYRILLLGARITARQLSIHGDIWMRCDGDTCFGKK